MEHLPRFLQDPSTSDLLEPASWSHFGVTAGPPGELFTFSSHKTAIPKNVQWDQDHHQHLRGTRAHQHLPPHLVRGANFTLRLDQVGTHRSPVPHTSQQTSLEPQHCSPPLCTAR